MVGADFLGAPPGRGPAVSSIRRLAARARRRSTARADPRLPPDLLTDRGQIPVRRVLEGLLGILHDVLPEPPAKDLLEVIRLERGDDLPYRRWTDRDVIGIAPHEAHRFSILSYLQDVSAQERAFPTGPTLPMQYGAAGVVPAEAEQSETGSELVGVAVPEHDGGVRPHDPIAVGSVEVDGHVSQGAAPLHDGGVVVRMRDRDGRNASQSLNGGNAAVIGQAQAIPEYVALAGANVKCALADGELRLGHQADQLGAFDVEPISMTALQIFEAGPFLPLPAHVLPLVLTDGAALGWEQRLGVLDSASGADEVGHSSDTALPAYALSNDLTVSMVSASSAFLSVLHRAMRGNRTAIPDLCRLDGCNPSKWSSKTSSGLTVRTGPNFSSVFRRMNWSTLRISWSVSPE